MNCKPGDLAVYVGKERCNLGQIYKVLRVYDGPQEGCYPGPAWWVDHHGKEWHCLDSSLRPIRPGDITDEEVRALYAPKLPEAA